MKRFGFTLAEVLITLAIIGVVSAITLPTLTSSTRNAQVGPKLAKAASMFEQATQAMLNDRNVDSLESLYINAADDNDGVRRFINDLSDFMKLTTFNNVESKRAVPTYNGIGGCGLILNPNERPAQCHFKTKDGIHFTMFKQEYDNEGQRQPHKIRYGTLFVDINGVKTSPNTYGRDVFAFAIYADGSLRPVGSNNWFEGNNACNWQEDCNDTIVQGYACTGHIFDNDLKILYR